jgi:hypothetical protein
MVISVQYGIRFIGPVRFEIVIKIRAETIVAAKSFGITALGLR